MLINFHRVSTLLAVFGLSACSSGPVPVGTNEPDIGSIGAASSAVSPAQPMAPPNAGSGASSFVSPAQPMAPPNAGSGASSFVSPAQPMAPPNAGSGASSFVSPAQPVAPVSDGGSDACGDRPVDTIGCPTGEPQPTCVVSDSGVASWIVTCP
jgi:hypothetical protein